jgi:hypothetical protein
MLVIVTIAPRLYFSEASSEFKDGQWGCRNVFDGNLVKGWATNCGFPQGEFIKLNFAGRQTINMLKFANRRSASNLWAITNVRVEFSDGYTTQVTLYKDSILHAFTLPTTTTKFVKITILSWHSTDNCIGAQEIEFWGPLDGGGH